MITCEPIKPGERIICAAVGCRIRIGKGGVMCMPHLNLASPAIVLRYLNARDAWERLVAQNDAVFEVAICEGRARRTLPKLFTKPAAIQAQQLELPVYGDAGIQRNPYHEQVTHQPHRPTHR